MGLRAFVADKIDFVSLIAIALSLIALAYKSSLESASNVELKFRLYLDDGTILKQGCFAEIDAFRRRILDDLIRLQKKEIDEMNGKYNIVPIGGLCYAV